MQERLRYRYCVPAPRPAPPRSRMAGLRGRAGPRAVLFLHTGLVSPGGSLPCPFVPSSAFCESQPTLEGAGVKLQRAFGFGETERIRSLPALRRFPQRAAGGLSRRLSLASASRHRDDHLRARRHGRAWRQPRQSRGARRRRRAVDDGRAAASCIRRCRRATPKGRMHGFQLWANLPVLAEDDRAALSGHSRHRDPRDRRR